MIGGGPGTDSSLLDTILSDAIACVYRRVASRLSNPVPTFSDLRDELANWRSGDRLQGESRSEALLRLNWLP